MIESSGGSESNRYPAKRSLGQHFLIDPNLQRKIVDALEIDPDDHVLEIGPGDGALTRHLVGRVGRLVMVELDDRLVEALERQYGAQPEVEIIHADILDVRPSDLLREDHPLKVIGNIPYGITSPLIFHLLDDRAHWESAVLTVQREIAERLTATAGTKEYGALTVGVRAVAQVEILFPVSRHAFRPRPQVDSMTIRITPRTSTPLTVDEEEALRRLTRSAFSRRRKQLQKVLRQAPEYGLRAEEAVAVLRSLDIDPRVRPDALPVADYLRLARRLTHPG